MLTIAIDGPSASGKTTTARAVARRLGYRYIDSGALYRALAVKALRRGVDADDLDRVRALLGETDADYAPDGTIELDGVPESASLREPRVSDYASRLSVHSPVRDWVNRRLRAAVEGGGVVMEGRDIGTVVLPDADVKIFLQASIEVRAERRRRDLGAAGHRGSRADVAGDLERRDRRDSGREVAPLAVAPDAVVIDGSALTFEEQVEAVLAEVARKGP